MNPCLYENDLPDNLSLSGDVAIDTETTGLSLSRDRLCLVQVAMPDADPILIRISPKHSGSPNLARILVDPAIEKIFHFARFDMAIIKRSLGVMPSPVFCTKIASKIARTYSDRHGLREITRELLRIELRKEQQSSDWGTEILSPEQIEYAAADVIHLHALRDKLRDMLHRENRLHLAEECFRFLPARCQLDLAGWNDVDLFTH